MADIYGSHFEYAGVSSRVYGLIIANVETSRFTKVSGSIGGAYIFNRSNKKRYLIENDYSDYPLSFEVDIVTDNERGIELNDRRAIEKWLFNKHDFRRLYLDITDDIWGETYEIVDGIEKRLYLYCRFVNPERLEYNGGIVGYRVTIETDSGMWYQDTTEKIFTLNNAGSATTSRIVVNVDSDLDEYIYPEVSFTMGSLGGNATIINHTDSDTRLTKFLNLDTGAYVYLKGDLNYVSGDYYEKFSGMNFPRLLDGENAITVMGNVKDITFKFNNRRSL